MRYQIFAPLGLLLILNLFWYYLMWRVLIRAIRGHISDEREDGEYDDDEQEAAATAAKMKEGKVAEEKAKVEEMTKEKGQ
jgi:acyl-CoA-dependent ceramide synthase